MQRRFCRLLARGIAAAAALGCLLAGAAPAEPWPYQPFDEPHALGNHYGTFQNYGGSPYYHDGIDLVTPSGPVDCYSVSDGTVTHVTYNQPYYSGIMIGDPVSGGEGWLYWHIDADTYVYDVGERVDVNDYIGTVAYWPVSNFHHVHFNKVEGTGGYPWSWYISIENPLALMDPHPDPDPPVHYATYAGRAFAFARNQASTLLDPFALTGDVDIVARISDVVGLPQWELNPWKVEYWIDGATQSVPVTDAVTFSGLIPNDNTVSVIYRTQSPLITQGNYDARVYYMNVTNTDGDGFVETSDASLSWETDGFDAGDYWVFVRAYDLGGNVVTDSMWCTVDGAIDPALELPDASHNFGTLLPGESEDWELRIGNSGSDPLSIRAVEVDDPAFSLDRAHFFVAPGGEETVTVTFAPDDYAEYDGIVTIESNDPAQPIAYVALTGMGGEFSATPEEEQRGEGFGLQAIHARPGGGLAVHFRLAHAGAAHVSIHDVTGRRIRQARLAGRPAGTQDWNWDGRSAAGALAPSGIYFVTLESGGEAATRTAWLVR